jgi:hypothetical protein
MTATTCRGLADRLVRLEMISRERADAGLAAIAEDAPDHDEELEYEDVLDVLGDFGVAVYVSGEDVDDLEDAYQEVLEQAVACTGRAVTISGVELTEDEDGDESLTFRLNGEPRSWPVEHQADDYLDLLAVWECIDDLEPGGDDPRLFHPVPGQDAGHDDVYILATPEQARALRDGLGLKIEVRDAADGDE